MAAAVESSGADGNTECTGTRASSLFGLIYNCETWCSTLPLYPSSWRAWQHLEAGLTWLQNTWAARGDRLCAGERGFCAREAFLFMLGVRSFREMYARPEVSDLLERQLLITTTALKSTLQFTSLAGRCRWVVFKVHSNSPHLPGGAEGL